MGSYGESVMTSGSFGESVLTSGSYGQWVMAMEGFSAYQYSSGYVILISGLLLSVI